MVKIKQIFWNGMFTVVVALLVCPVVYGQDSVEAARREKARIEKEIRAIDARTDRTDSLMRQERKRFAVLEQRIVEGTERKKADIDTLNEKLAELNTEIQRLTGAVAQQRAGDRAVQARRGYITAQLVELCGRLSAQIKRSLPWDREERLARVNALRSDLKNGSARIEDGFSRLLALLDEETTFGDEVVLATRTVQRNDGSSVSARVMRIGNMWMLYVDASEQMYGVLHRENDTTFIWNEELDFEQREQVRTAIRVKESKKAPQIVSLPVITSLRKKEDD